METHELALLAAVAIPAAAIAGLNVFLALTGERDTLLLPPPRPLTFHAPAAEPAAEPEPLADEASAVAVPEPVACPVPEPAVAEKRPVFVARPAFSAFRRFPLAGDGVRT